MSKSTTERPVQSALPPISHPYFNPTGGPIKLGSPDAPALTLPQHNWDVRRLNAVLRAHGYNWCSRCATAKPLTEFSPRPKSLGGVNPYCKACVNAYHDPIVSSAKARERNYGLTHEEYETLLATQGGGCAICGAPPTIDARAKTTEVSLLQVDHDHTTKAIRGLLCGPCNRGIGALGDDPARLRAAATYLDSHNHP